MRQLALDLDSLADFRLRPWAEADAAFEPLVKIAKLLKNALGLHHLDLRLDLHPDFEKTQGANIAMAALGEHLRDVPRVTLDRLDVATADARLRGCRSLERVCLHQARRAMRVTKKRAATLEKASRFRMASTDERRRRRHQHDAVQRLHDEFPPPIAEMGEFERRVAANPRAATEEASGSQTIWWKLARRPDLTN